LTEITFRLTQNGADQPRGRFPTLRPACHSAVENAARGQTKSRKENTMATLPRPAEPNRSPSLELLEPPPFFAKPKRLLDVSDVAEWLGVSKGWIRDHASGRRQPRLFAIKLGPAKGKGLWKFREEDVHQFIQDQRRR
jgi:predicted DNA-binding transcriptional regulator AlpA